MAYESQVLGTLLGQVLREPKLANLEVLLTGQVAFAEAVKRAAGGAKVSWSWWPWLTGGPLVAMMGHVSTND
eukprot:Skav202456  [mRNA]  locus=scaffold149:177216:179022:+ [translate_table: standard]